MSPRLWWCLVVLLNLVPASLQRETWREDDADEGVEADDEYVWPEEEEHENGGGSPTSSLASRVSSGSACITQLYGANYYYSSPNFGVSDYPNNTRCYKNFATLYTWVMKIVQFEVQPRVQQRCRDALKITLPYGRRINLCGRLRRRPKTTIKSNFFGFNFFTDALITRPGYNISLTRVRNSCSKYITETQVGATNVLSTPDYGLPHQENVRCGFRIKAPSGSRVRIDYLSIISRKSRGCTKDWLLADTFGHFSYPTYTAYRYCGTKNITDLPISYSRYMLIYYRGAKNKSSGIELKYTIV